MKIVLSEIGTSIYRALHTDFGMGGTQLGSMGGDWRVMGDKIKWTKKRSVNL